VLTPTSQMRARRELEPPSLDEGWAVLERAAFAREPRSPPGAVGVFVAAAALARPGCAQALDDADRGAPHLLFDWRPGADPGALAPAAAELATGVSGRVEHALCSHPAGPPSCWCRPPLPGLPLAFARACGVEPARSVLIGTGPAHRALADALGARYAEP
jgi:hypothetical protein